MYLRKGWLWIYLYTVFVAVPKQPTNYNLYKDPLLRPYNKKIIPSVNCKGAWEFPYVLPVNCFCKWYQRYFLWNFTENNNKCGIYAAFK
jgi:hypothetical protein